MVITLMVGERSRKLPSDSSASATMYSLAPSLALVPKESRRPPMMMVGSSLAALRTVATRLVVVVFPCVPPMAMPNFARINSASISARGITGTNCARAATLSGLSGLMAELRTRTSAP